MHRFPKTSLIKMLTYYFNNFYAAHENNTADTDF